MNFGLEFLKHFGGNVELCVIDECGMKRMREVLFSQGQLSAKCICCRSNNLTNSSLDFQREIEWEKRELGLVSLVGVVVLDGYYPRKLVSFNLEFYNSS
jgi:hypothetical protein